MDGLLLEDALGQATALLRELALGGAGRQKLVLHALAVDLLGMRGACHASLEAAVKAALRRAPCFTKPNGTQTSKGKGVGGGG